MGGKMQACRPGTGEALLFSPPRIPAASMRMLRVYEVRGSGPPRDIPEENLEGIWPEPPFYYLFYRKESIEPVLGWLKRRPGWQLTSRYDLPYESWQDISAHEVNLGAFSIRLSANPAAARREAPSLTSAAGTAMVIDPGIVFGSGLHPATQGCLLAVSHILRTNEIHTAVDFGTGTGILAIACALSGTGFTLAVDRNPLALETARRNARANGVEGRIGFLQADGTACQNLSPDLFIMNLEWPALEKILIAGHWKNASRVVLAGFLESRTRPVETLAQPEFHVDSAINREGWPTLILSRA